MGRVRSGARARKSPPLWAEWLATNFAFRQSLFEFLQPRVRYLGIVEDQNLQLRQSGQLLQAHPSSCFRIERARRLGYSVLRPLPAVFARRPDRDDELENVLVINGGQLLMTCTLGVMD